VPGYLNQEAELKAKGISEVIIYCCNDGAVMMAWGKNQCVEGSLITMMGDTQGDFTKALGVSMTHPGPIGKLGGPRCKRHAIYVEDGIIKAFEVAAYPDDPAGDAKPDVTLSDNMLSKIPDLMPYEQEQVLADIEAEKEEDIAAVSDAVNSDKLVLFVKPSCTFSEKALEELCANGFRPRVFKTTRSQKRGLQALTGKTSMPSAWVNNTYIGGCNDGIEDWHGVVPMVANGMLAQMLEQA
jgi:peroxiredoxin/glutaredoxin-related protein